MNFLLPNGAIIWIPVYQLRGNAYEDKTYLFLTFIYVIFLLISAYFTFVLIKTSWLVPKFHPNMTICMGFGFGSWFEIFVAICILGPYKCGLITVNDTNITFAGFENEEKSNMTLVTKFPEAIPLFIGGFMIWHYIGTVIAAMCIFVLERAIASFFFSDYEKKKRKCIAVFLLCLSQFIVIFMVILVFIYKINLIGAVSIAISFFTFVIISFISLLYYNVNLRNKLDKNYVGFYSLAARFQVEENARSLELAVRLVCVIMVIAALAIGLIIVSANKWLPYEYDSTLISLFEYICCLNPIVIVPAAMLRIPEWKIAFCRSIPIIENRIKPTNKVVNRRLSLETDLYFIQLRDSWI